MSSETAQRKQRLAKAGDAFRTISEVSQTLEVQQHVLRFWETKFNQIKPIKRGGGRRYYRPEDIDLLRYIHKLLYTEGYTIKGVQKLLKTQSKGELMEAAASNAPHLVETASPLTQRAIQQAASAQKAAKIISPVTSPRDATVARDLRQKRILQAMLGDLVELRNTVRAVRDATSN